MKYDRRLAGLRLKPSGEGQIHMSLDRDDRATLVGIDVYEGRLVRIRRDGRKRTETWARVFWIPLRGNYQWGKR